MGRGRPATLKNRQSTCVSLEDRHREYLAKHNVEISKFLRDCIDSLIENEETPDEQLVREIEELDRDINEKLVLKHQKEEKLKEVRELRETETQQKKAVEEFEQKKYEYVLGCKDTMMRKGNCTKMWLDHLLEAYKFPTYDDARSYVKGVWLDNDVPEKRVNAFFENR